MDFLFEFLPENLEMVAGPGRTNTDSSPTPGSTLSLLSADGTMPADGDDSALLLAYLEMEGFVLKSETQHVPPTSPETTNFGSSNYSHGCGQYAEECLFRNSVAPVIQPPHIFNTEGLLQPSHLENNSSPAPTTMITTKLFNYSLEGVQRSCECLQLKMSNLTPSAVSASVMSATLQEFALQDWYLDAIERGEIKFLEEKVRKRRNPENDELVWTPLSVYQAAYTSIKISPLDKTDYHLQIPQISCFGKINMRTKRAWVRKSNRKNEHTIYRFRNC